MTIANYEELIKEYFNKNPPNLYDEDYLRLNCKCGATVHQIGTTQHMVTGVNTATCQVCGNKQSNKNWEELIKLMDDT